MKITERYLWIAAIILGGFMFQSQQDNNKNLQTLLQSYAVETNIQNAQINDFSSQLAVVTAESYSQGFEAGKTQAGVALARGESLYDYTEGYHAAIGQNIEESDILTVSEGIMNELASLRKMVPRLLNQNTELQTELDSLVDSNYVMEMLMDTLDAGESIDEAYLGIIDTLLESQGRPVPIVPNFPQLDDKSIVKETEK
jgi:hypothetical protein